jgi:hypothetical protein
MADNRETICSASGFEIYLLTVPVYWPSKGKRVLTLSSSEAEYAAILEATKEIKFMFILARTMNCKSIFQMWLKQSLSELFHVLIQIDWPTESTCQHEVSFI